MAYTINEEPNNAYFASTLQPIIWSVSDTAMGFKYRFTLRIKDASGTELVRLHQQPNNSASAVFDVSNVLDSYVDLNPYLTPPNLATNVSSVHTTGPYSAQSSLMPKTAEFFLVDAGHTSATTADGIPTTTWEYTDRKVTAMRWQGVNSDQVGWNQVLANSGYLLQDFTDDGYNTPVFSDSPLNTAATIGSDWTWLNAGTKVFESFVSEDGWRTLTRAVGSVAPMTVVKASDWTNIKVYLNSTLQASQAKSNTGLGGVMSADVNLAEELIQCTAVGPANLISSNIWTDIATAFVTNTWTHFDVVFSENEGADQQSHLYRFKRLDKNCFYEAVTLAFSNRSGGWDYIDFTLEKKRKTRVTSRNRFDGLQGNYLEASSTIPFRSTGLEGGITTRRVQSRRSVMVNTGFYPESQNDLMESLYLARDVYEITPAGVVTKVYVTDSSWKELTRNLDNQFRYSVSYEYAKERIT